MTLGIRIPSNLVCRYCGIASDEADLYIVLRNSGVEGFDLACYEKHLDDKRVGK